jgi:pimeloyl-ACP methyl ester carboxylesterase
MMSMRAMLLAVVLAGLVHPAAAQAPHEIGVVLMHGKGGSPTGHVAELAASLQQRGYLVANLEMPWSQRRSYDASVADAVAQVEAALEALRSKGAADLFVAGHSQGGLFALYFGGQHVIGGVIAIAPGGNVASPGYRDKLSESVARARQLVAEGRGNEPSRFLDLEGSRGTFAIYCTAAHYLSWFDPEGAMNASTAVSRMSPAVPVLFIAPSGDYPPLRSAKQAMFSALPPNPLTRLYEPTSGHLDAPSAAAEEIERWIGDVAARAEGTRQGARTPAAEISPVK